jgi:glycosyltransferase involved in cell wall biosynthesis
MRVLVISHSTADHLGGAERSLLALLEAWRETEPAVEPVVVGPAAAAMHDALTARGIESLVLPMSGWAVFEADGGAAQRRLRARENAVATRALLELIDERRPALVISNTLVLPWGAVAAAERGVPHVWFVREFGERVQGFLWPDGREAALRDIGTLSTAVVANSSAVADMLRPFVDDGALTVSFPPVDLERVRALAEHPTASPFSTDAALTVAVLGRVTRSKGQWRLVEALGRAATAGIEVCFVGAVLDRGAEAQLTARARAIAPNARLVFAGEQQNPFAWVRAADVAVVPSEKEAFGRSTLECLALGLPVVTTSSGAGAELVEHGVSGLLVDPDDVSALAAALDRYATEPGLIAEHGAAARVRADALAGHELGLGAAIAALRSAVGARPAALPPRWRAWVDELEATAARPTAERLLRLRAALSTVVRRGARGLRHPVRASRRLAAALRRRADH